MDHAKAKRPKELMSIQMMTTFVHDVEHVKMTNALAFFCSLSWPIGPPNNFGSSTDLKFAVKFLRIQHLCVNRFGTFTWFPGHFGVHSDGNNFDCRLAWSHMMSGDSCSYYYFSWKTWLWQKNTREGWYYRGGPTITLSLFLDLLANRSGVIFFCAC